MIYITVYDLMNGSKFGTVSEDLEVKNRTELEILRKELQEKYDCLVFFKYIKK